MNAFCSGFLAVFISISTLGIISAGRPPSNIPRIRVISSVVSAVESDLDTDWAAEWFSTAARRINESISRFISKRVLVGS